MNTFVHVADLRPFLGSPQPATGLVLPLASLVMGRRKKDDTEPVQIRFVVAYNVKLLRDEVYSSEINRTKRNRRLARATNTSLSQIQRICQAELSVGIDIIERMARALKCAPADLLTPYFAIRRKEKNELNHATLTDHP